VPYGVLLGIADLLRGEQDRCESFIALGTRFHLAIRVFH
jgi:hypothetical protein